ncbi:MAG: Multiple EGF-like-domain protein 3 precursor, partial [Myxococcaceae bacterium]|nr:Multiple EGF-like-domain protein 3 precursor [Myxococcaceae bacterium]
MKLSLACLAAAAAVVVACATNPPLDFVGEPPPSSSTPIPGPPAPDDAGAADAADADAGKVEQGTCGDGKVTADEECDDGNNASGDGCSATCKGESSGPDDVCPGTTIALTGTGADTRHGTVSSTTATMYGQYAGSCGGGTGQDAVYVVTPDVTGLLTAKLTSTFDSILYARRTCNDSKTESACNDAPGLNGGDTVTMVVTKAVPVYLFVDGYSGAAGPFTLDVQVTSSFCGNGTAEAPEVCDDGNTVAGDGCAPDCTLEAGGDITDCPGQPVTLTG